MSSTNQLEKLLKDQINANPHSNVTSKISAFVRGVISFLNLGERLDADSIVSVAKQVWDNYVVTYDWQFIPDWLEERLEDQAWKTLEVLIRDLVEKYLEQDAGLPEGELFTMPNPNA